MSGKLIIFDYSGTLSIEGAAFSHVDALTGHLHKSGLFALGVDNPELFWKIVNATWVEGSTTRRGYKKVLQESVSELFPEKSVVKQEEISRSAANFVAAYLDHSRIDENWRLILQKLSVDKSVMVVIATDHYAEATNAIINHLAQWGIEAIPLHIPADTVSGGRLSFQSRFQGNFIVANSADLGVHKADRQFWRRVNNVLAQDFNRILLIDDFGCNEEAGDAYGEAKKIGKRRRATERILQEVFGVTVQSFFFSGKEQQMREMIAEVSAIIDQFLC